MARLVLLLLAVAFLYLLFRWLIAQPARTRWQVVAFIVAALLLALVVTGRAHWLAALFAALLPFLRALLGLAGNWPILKRILGGLGGAGAAPAGASGNQQNSTVQSQYIRMTLNHDTGEINGQVLAGRYSGKMLNQLDLQQLLDLMNECQEDEESVSLLQAYLDRVHEDWHEQANEQSRQTTSPSDGRLTRREALEILGLEGNPDEQQIVEAHRRLIQKLHPDRGGSAYLAAKINQAKDTLLGQ